MTRTPGSSEAGNEDEAWLFSCLDMVRERAGGIKTSLSTAEPRSEAYSECFQPTGRLVRS